MDISIASILARTITNATPLVLAGVGGICCERSGITNIGIEGMMLTGAFAAVAGSYFTGNAWFGLFYGVLASTLVALLHAYLCITVKINHIISGLAINIFASSMSIYLMNLFFGSKGSSPNVKQLPVLSLPWAKNIPVIGELLSGISVITLLGVMIIFIINWVLNKTSFGLHIIACGQKSVAASVVGINVSRVQYFSVLMSGVCSGLAGSFLSISFMNVFVKNMVAGRGYIAIATMIFGRYHPLEVACAALLFGFLDAVQMSLQGTINIPRELVQSIPYVVTIVAVALATHKNRAQEN